MQPNDSSNDITGVKPVKKTEYVYDRRLTDDDGASHGIGNTHGTEMGWLVSYADMMTLLFGLFVLLYVMASEKKGNIQENMKEVSEKYFSATPTLEKNKTEPITSTSKNIYDPAQFERLQAQLEKARAEVAKLKIIPDQRQQVVTLEKEIQNLKEIQTKNQIPDQSENLKLLQIKLQSAQAKVQELKLIPDQRNAVTALEKKIEELKKQNQDLNQKESADRSIASAEKKFMMISAIWTTEKHDVDLYVTDPNGFSYSFKNKRGPDSIGNFEIDSRFGPGLELWKTEDLKPGKYQVRVDLYKQYENLKDAEVKIHIVTSRGSQYLKPAVLNINHKDQRYEFNVDEKGNISVL